MGAISSVRTDGSGPSSASLTDYTLVCFSHLRWNFVFQRPQHLMSRFAAEHRVIFWEEPIASQSDEATLDVSTCEQTGVIVVTPRLPEPLGGADQDHVLRTLLEIYLAGQQGPLVRWYYTPMMLPFSRHIEAACTVYDCMDELANFKFAPPQLLELERELLEEADVVFTGGYSLYEAKKDRHPNIHPFPSSVDRGRSEERRVGKEC